MEEQDSRHSRPSLSRIIKKGFGDIYDYLGLVVAASFIWLVAALIPITLGVELTKRMSNPVPFVLGMVGTFIISVGLGAGIFYMAHKIVYRDEPSLKDLLEGFRGLFLPALALALVDLIITAVLFADLGFFFGLFKVSRPFAHNPVFFVVGVLFVWVTVFWLMTALYHPTLLISTRYLPELEVSRPNTSAVLRRGLLLAAGAPFFTMVFLFAIIALTILPAIKPVGMAIFVIYPGIFAVVLTHLTRALFVSYGVVGERPETVDDTGWKLKP